MKKILLFSVLLSIVLALNAQTQFSVPTRTLQQKYNYSRMLLYNNVLALINIAKSDGTTPAELGKSIGEKFPWDKNSTYEQLVNFMLTATASLTDSVKIIEQSNEKIVFTAPHIYPNLERQGVIYGSTVEELIEYWDAMMVAIANPLGISCKWTWGEEGQKIEISKK
jgi:hypothetical protein